MPDDYGTNMAAASQLAVAAVNSSASASMNRRTRKWNEEQYRKQRENALSDWNMQNEYNSPQAQMERLRKAGLNPNLVYGNGATATSEAPPRQTDIKPWTPHAPQIDSNMVGDIVNRYYDVRIKEATYDNLRTQNTVLTNEAVLKDAQTTATLKQAGYTDAQIAALLQETGFRGSLNPISLQAAEAGVNKTLADTQFTLDQNERAAILNASSIKEAAARILHMRYQNTKIESEKNEIRSRIKNLDADTRLKEADAKLKEQGIQPHDKLYQRWLAEWLTGDNNKVPTTGTESTLKTIVNPLWWMRKK